MKNRNKNKRRNINTSPIAGGQKPKPVIINYESLFIRDSPISTRSGKGVYIRKDFHERIMRIIRVIGYNKISLFSYLDNVLGHHFDTYQDDISKLYKERNSDIF